MPKKTDIRFTWKYLYFSHWYCRKTNTVFFRLATCVESFTLDPLNKGRGNSRATSPSPLEVNTGTFLSSFSGHFFSFFSDPATAPISDLSEVLIRLSELAIRYETLTYLVRNGVFYVLNESDVWFEVPSAVVVREPSEGLL